MNYQEEIENLLPKLPHRLQVSFALYCAKDVYHLAEDKEVTKKILNVVEAWLRGEVSAQDCYDAANVAYAAVYDAASNAAYTAASNAASAAAYAATHAVASSAAFNAAYAAAKANSKSINYYHEILIDMINSLSKVEKAVWRLE